MHYLLLGCFLEHLAKAEHQALEGTCPKTPVCWAEIQEMRALTLHQPWASLIVIGAKATETRSWAAPRWLWGNIFGIHAGKREDRAFRETDPDVVDLLGCEPTPKGAIVAIARLKDCIPTERSIPGFQDEHFGDFSAGRFAWRLTDVQPLVEPLPLTGHQGLWTIPPELVAVIMRNLAIR